jgi:hypothetical protein
MRKYLSLLFLFALQIISYGQNTFPATGNVGIGTASPTAPLQVNGTANDLINVIASGGGRGGIYIQNQNATAQATLYLENNRGAFASYSGLVTGGSTNGYPAIFGLSRADRGFYVSDGPSSLGLGVGTITAQPLVFGTNNVERLRVGSNGNVLIGKTSQINTGYILDVNGSARATSVVVNTTGADYVFDSAYSLPSLEKIEKFIGEHHHLPGIAPAEEMQKQGVDLGDNQTRLLAKIEELTLYVINQQKQMDVLQKRLKILEDQPGRVSKKKAQK